MPLQPVQIYRLLKNPSSLLTLSPNHTPVVPVQRRDAEKSIGWESFFGAKRRYHSFPVGPTWIKVAGRRRNSGVCWAQAGVSGCGSVNHQMCKHIEHLQPRATLQCSRGDSSHLDLKSYMVSKLLGSPDETICFVPWVEPGDISCKKWYIYRNVKFQGAGIIQKFRSS